MSNETEALLSAALRLPPDERGKLAEQIYRSLANDAPTPQQAEEIERRIDEMRSGEVRTIPGDEAYSQVLQRLGGGARP